jgi:parvulin-like peptidyl-prolyl isomerase
MVASALALSMFLLPACDRDTPPSGDDTTVATAAADSSGWLLTSHILIRHRDPNSETDSLRTKNEARMIAESVRRRVESGAESFEDIARQVSEDDSNKARGGRLGPFRAETGRPIYVATALALRPGEVSSPVDTDLGYLIVTRHPLEVAEFQSILVGFEGTELSRSDRTREEARALAERALAAVGSERTFQSVAEQFSDRDHDDVTIEVARGTMSSSVDEIVFSLAPGELSGVRETEYGFHVIRRLR